MIYDMLSSSTPSTSEHQYCISIENDLRMIESLSPPRPVSTPISSRTFTTLSSCTVPTLTTSLPRSPCRKFLGSKRIVTLRQLVLRVFCCVDMEEDSHNMDENDKVVSARQKNHHYRIVRGGVTPGHKAKQVGAVFVLAVLHGFGDGMSCSILLRVCKSGLVFRARDVVDCVLNHASHATRTNCPMQVKVRDAQEESRRRLQELPPPPASARCQQIFGEMLSLTEWKVGTCIVYMIYADTIVGVSCSALVSETKSTPVAGAWLRPSLLSGILDMSAVQCHIRRDIYGVNMKSTLIADAWWRRWLTHVTRRQRRK